MAFHLLPSPNSSLPSTVSLQQMRDVSDRKKELEKQQQMVQEQLRQREAVLRQPDGEGKSGTERQAAADAVQALKSTVRG